MHHDAPLPVNWHCDGVTFPQHRHSPFGLRNRQIGRRWSPVANPGSRLELTFQVGWLRLVKRCIHFRMLAVQFRECRGWTKREWLILYWFALTTGPMQSRGCLKTYRVSIRSVNRTWFNGWVKEQNIRQHLLLKPTEMQMCLGLCLRLESNH